MENLAQTLFPKSLVTWTPEDLVEFGKSRGWYFQIMEEKGVLTGKVQKTYAVSKTLWDFEPDSNTNITQEKKKGYQILAEVREAGFPIKQVIYGCQVKPEKKPLKLPQIKVSPDTVEFATAVVAGSIMLVIGAATLVAYGLLMALASDPALIVVLDDGKDSWVCLHSWDE